MSNPFEKLHEITWPDVFELWRTNEQATANWREIGFSSWDDFRLKPILDLHLAEKKWTLHRITSPAATVPGFFGGPFKGWVQDYYRGKNFVTFAEISTFPKIEKDRAVADIIIHPPKTTMLIGLQTETGVMIIEGTHRCLAVALAAQKNQTVQMDITIALAPATTAEVSLAMDGVYEEYQIPRT